MDHTYQLIIHLKSAHRLTIGAIGAHDFPAGFYVYTGSAKRNLAARIERHKRKEKPLRWHIDYLTTQPDASIVEVKTYDKNECELNQQISGEIIIKGFGASDCKQGCGAHLKYLGKKLNRL